MISVGARVGNYEVKEQIGKGAMGSVFMAIHPGIGKKVALKVIHPELATNEEMVTRFFNEARFVSQLGHENIVEVKDFGQTPDGDNFIVMELLEGLRLSDRISRERVLTINRALHIAIQLADGLAAAHARGIIHRDLKPDNIFLIERNGDHDFVKILDFGLAKLTGPSAGMLQAKTQTGSLLGTAHYMAPEQAESSKTLDQRVDVYALGCIMFEMMTGRVPFPGVGFGDVLIKHIREPPTMPSRLNAQIPPAVEKIILHALAKKPQFRFKDMEDFRTALRDPDRFARSLDSADGGRLTPGEMPAPNMPQPLAPQTIILPQSPSAAPKSLDGQARTVMGEAPMAVTLLGTSGPPVFDQPTMVPRPQPTRPIPPPQKGGGGGGVIVLILVLLVAIGGGGAGAFFWLKTRALTISVTTDPVGVEVFEGATKLGDAPLTMKRKKGESVTLTFKKSGFMNAQRVVVVSANDELKVTLNKLPPPEPVEEPAKPEPVVAKPVEPAKPTPTPTPTPKKPDPVVAKPEPAKPTPKPEPVATKPEPKKPEPKKPEPKKAEPKKAEPKKTEHKSSHSKPTTSPIIMTPSF